MISVLIPVFNQDVRKLVGDLSRQLSALDVDGEIVVMDDGSEPSWQALNQAVEKLPHVKYSCINLNQGRIRIRALLASAAQYDWLLFLDGDSLILSEDFLKNYQIPDAPAVVVGGRRYLDSPPADCRYALHWKYGRERESRAGAGFMTNNFLIARRFFELLDVETSWRGYGHEDTWIGIQLEQLQAPVRFIDNNTLHEGLETTDVFLEKSRQALYNLKRLELLVSAEALQKHVKLYRIYILLKRFHLLWILSLFTKKFLLKNLHSCKPLLRFFDWYRLKVLVEIYNS